MAETLHAEVRWRLVLLGFTVVCRLIPTSGLKMVPEKAGLVLLKGDALELKCIHQYQQGSAPDSLFFTKDGVILNKITSLPKLLGEMWTDTYTYSVTETTMLDTGNYECKLQNSGTTSNIRVFVFRFPNLQNVEYVKGGATLTLNCDLEEGDDKRLEYEVNWSHMNATLTEGTKYKIVNNSLEIQNPGRDDMGEYQCTITFFPKSAADRHIVRPGSVSVLARPEIDKQDHNKNMVQGDDLEFKCKVSGFPKPEVNWFKDGTKVNETKRTHLDVHEGTDHGKLIIYSLEYEDAGMYTCIASNEFNGMVYNATGEMKLGVKDKLAALWPFLGIVAEVVILCAIILCYEKSRSKKLSDEDDATDANVENTVDHGDVRHRRT